MTNMYKIVARQNMSESFWEKIEIVNYLDIV